MKVGYKDFKLTPIMFFLVMTLETLGDGYKIVLRPHPQFLRAKREYIIGLEKKYKDDENIVVETDLVSDINIHMAAILVTDWSGIAFEYAFGTERPVLFIDTPRKVFNPEYEKIQIEPISVKLRDEIGIAVSTNELSTVSRAVMTWSLPERVKRLAMPTYLYGAHELDHLDMTLAEDDAGHPVGVAAWEPADLRDCPAGQRGLLLHGLYVDPVHQGHGVGSRLLDAAAEQGRSGGYDGILVKAQADAEGFFQRRGLRSIPVLDPGRDYPNRCWLDLITLD